MDIFCLISGVKSSSSLGRIKIVFHKSDAKTGITCDFVLRIRRAVILVLFKLYRAVFVYFSLLFVFNLM